MPRDLLTIADARRLLAAAEPHLDRCTIQAVRQIESDADWVAVRDLATTSPDLARLAIAESERADSLRAALDAIRRAHDPDGLHTVECAANDEESACDCGLDRAAADVVAYAYEVLLGRALTTEEIADAIERGDHISPDRGEE